MNPQQFAWPLVAAGFIGLLESELAAVGWPFGRIGLRLARRTACQAVPDYDSSHDIF